MPPRLAVRFVARELKLGPGDLFSTVAGLRAYPVACRADFAGVDGQEIPPGLGSVMHTGLEVSAYVTQSSQTSSMSLLAVLKGGRRLGFARYLGFVQVTSRRTKVLSSSTLPPSVTEQFYTKQRWEAAPFSSRLCHKSLPCGLLDLLLSSIERTLLQYGPRGFPYSGCLTSTSNPAAPSTLNNLQHQNARFLDYDTYLTPVLQFFNRCPRLPCPRDLHATSRVIQHRRRYGRV